MTTFALPWPPAVNNLYINVRRGRVASPRYRDWMETALACLPRTHIPGGVRVTITAYRPDRRRRDLDGILKAPLDCLVKGGVIEDDSFVDAINLRWAPNSPAKPGSLMVTVEAVDIMGDAP